MKITVINGTQVRQCTYHIKEMFLSVLRDKNEITEFYLPNDLPHFCCGCKNCFFIDESRCPHADCIKPIWEAMMEADLLVFAYPVYALRAPAQVKSLLDHLCCHWMVHRPEPGMFRKRAVILTNSIGAPNGPAQSDVKTSLSWMGVSKVYSLGFGLMEGVIWNELSAKKRGRIEKKVYELAIKCRRVTPPHKSIRVRCYFMACRALQKSLLKRQGTPSADGQHWIDNGWIRGREERV